MSICTCVGMCGCGGAIVDGVLYYHYSNCNNKNNECKNELRKIEKFIK